MKAFLNKLLLFTVSYLAFILIIIFASAQSATIEKYTFHNRSNHGETVYRIPEFRQTIKDNKSLELLFLGSSTCYRGINPNKFDSITPETFSLCSSSQTLHVSNELLQWAGKLGVRPETIILDVYPMIWDFSSTEAIHDLVRNDPSPFDPMFLQIAFRTRDLHTMLTALYFGLKDWILPSIPKPNNKYVGKGFTYSTGEPTKPIPCESALTVLSSEQNSAMLQIKKTADNWKSSLILVNPPQLCEETFNVPEVMTQMHWIDGNEWPLAKVDSLYFDDHHLRGVGAELYSEWLAKRVKVVLNLEHH